MSFKADLKARWQCHNFTNYYKCRKLCDRCSAVQPATNTPDAMSYKNTSKTAPYARTCIDHDEYVRTARSVSPWSVVPGWQFETVSFDLMHIIFLGIGKNHIPSCLKILHMFGYHYEAGESNANFLKMVSLEMKQDCREHRFLSPHAYVVTFGFTPLNLEPPQTHDCLWDNGFCSILRFQLQKTNLSIL